MMTEEISNLWDTMVELDIATEAELGLAVALMGTTIETLNMVLSIRTGYRSIDQYLEEDEEE